MISAGTEHWASKTDSRFLPPLASRPTEFEEAGETDGCIDRMAGVDTISPCSGCSAYLILEKIVVQRRQIIEKANPVWECKSTPTEQECKSTTRIQEAPRPNLTCRMLQSQKHPPIPPCLDAEKVPAMHSHVAQQILYSYKILVF